MKLRDMILRIKHFFGHEKEERMRPLEDDADNSIDELRALGMLCRIENEQRARQGT